MLKLLIALCALTLTLQPAFAQHGGHHGGWANPTWGPHHGPQWGSPGGGFWGGVVGGTIGSLLFPREREVVIVPQETPELVPGSPSWYAYCQNKYRSWDGSSYLGFDGQRHPCT